MRVLYGVCGHGMGHATRAPVAVSHLESLGHEVRVVTTSDAAADHLDARLSADAGPAIRALGLAVAYRDNAVQHAHTLVDAAVRLFAMPLANLPALGAALEFRPDVVVTDFDVCTAVFARRLQIPLVTLDNVHFTSRCHHDAALLSDPADRVSARLCRAYCDALAPNAAHYMVMTLARPVSMLPRTSLHLPLLRAPVLEARDWARRDGEHLTCYFSGSLDHDALRAALRASRVPCRYFGDPRVDRPTIDGCVTSLPYSERGFLTSLVSGRGAVSGAGFTLLGECAYLGVPVLAVPIAGQHEQELCGAYLERLGYGRVARAITTESVRAFVDELPSLRERVAGYWHDDNAECLASLGRLVELHGASGRGRKWSVGA